MHTIPPLLAALGGITAVSVKMARTPSHVNWLIRSAMLSLVGDEARGNGRHQPLRRDWQDNWWWGPCVADR
jgi:hypothetical protein